jgi:hypothetical protein
MSPHRLLSAALLGTLFVPSHARAQAPAGNAQYITTAESGAPAAIAGKAAIVKIDPKGTLTTVRAGTNGFTCFVGVPGDPDAPFCGDANAITWIVSAASGKPKPTNTAPGIAYMAQGGVHYETAAGEIVMEPRPGTTKVDEPPHWMLMWAFEAGASGLPTTPNPAGVYIMFAGTPYAHLMVYQNPNHMAK